MNLLWRAAKGGDVGKSDERYQARKLIVFQRLEKKLKLNHYQRKALDSLF